MHVKDDLKKKINDKVGSCIFWFVAMLIAAVATFIWRTKVAFFILAVTIIFFILLLMELCLVCSKAKKMLSDEKRSSQEKANENFARQEPEKNLYEVLRDFRNDHNERLYDMAERLGIKSWELSKIENGHEKNRKKVKEVLIKIENAYDLNGIEMSTLIFGYLTTYGEDEEVE